MWLNSEPPAPRLGQDLCVGQETSIPERFGLVCQPVHPSVRPQPFESSGSSRREVPSFRRDPPPPPDGQTFPITLMGDWQAVRGQEPAATAGGGDAPLIRVLLWDHMAALSLREETSKQLTFEKRSTMKPKRARGATKPGSRCSGPGRGVGSGGGLGSWRGVGGGAGGWERRGASVPGSAVRTKASVAGAGGDRTCLCPPGHLPHVAGCQLATVADSPREQCTPPRPTFQPPGSLRTHAVPRCSSLGGAGGAGRAGPP